MKNGKKYQALSMQMIDHQFQGNFLLCLGFIQSDKNTNVVVAEGELLTIERASSTSITSASGSRGIIGAALTETLSEALKSNFAGQSMK